MSESRGKSLDYLKTLDEKRKRRIRDAVLILEADPVPFKACDVVKLKGFENAYRIRIGDHRIVYEVQWQKRIIIISYIGPRGKAYK